MIRQLKVLAIASSLALGAFACTTATSEEAASLEEQALAGPYADEGDEGECSARGERRGPRGEHHRRGHHGPDFSALNLSEAQETEIAGIRASTREQMETLRAEGRSEASREAMHTLFEEQRALIDGVLTPAQKTVLEASHAEHRAERMGRHLERMTEELSLTPEQAASVQGIMEASTGRDGREAARAAIREVLSSEQQVMLDSMHEARGERHERRGHRRGHGEGRHGEGRRGPAGAGLDLRGI